MEDKNIINIKNGIVRWMKERVENAGAKGVIFGLSGGIDSAIVAALSKEAFGKNALGIMMPIESDPEDEIDARLVADHLDLEIQLVDLTPTFLEMMKANPSIDHELAISNVKPRLRMTELYLLGQAKNYLVLGATNLSEFTVGYFTKHGDTGSDLMPIVDLTKREVYQLAEYYNIPEKIIKKAPSAGLLEDQVDEEEFDFSYDELDNYIENGIGNKSTIEKIESMKKRSQHKKEFTKLYKK